MSAKRVAKDLVVELFAIADAADVLRKEIRSSEIDGPVQAIEEACNEIKKSWSGSNVGYHATVYFAGLVPKPSDVQFSSEWGLMDRWPTHQPHPQWRTFEDDEVLKEIQKRAGSPDLKSLTNTLDEIRERFFDLQEQSKSILTSLIDHRADGFLAEKLERVTKLIAPVPSFIARDLLPKGQFWSRDSLAVTQGLRLAPHQSAIALPLSAITLRNGIDALERAAREAASHVQRIDSRNEKSASVGTNVFIGHGRSPLWRELRDFVEKRLHLPVDEFNSVPVAGVATTERLSELLKSAAFAFLVMTAEDEQADGKVRARENVVHEVGLFQGKLGFSRAIVLLEEGCEEFSNIHGLGQIRFPKGNISAKFEDIRAVLEREGLIETK